MLNPKVKILNIRASKICFLAVFNSSIFSISFLLSSEKMLSFKNSFVLKMNSSLTGYDISYSILLKTLFIKAFLYFSKRFLETSSSLISLKTTKEHKAFFSLFLEPEV